MAHNELPQASADRVRAKINAADTLLTQGIKWLPTELLDGKRTKQEVEAILCRTSKEWAWDVFVTILREWAEIGIPPDDFEAIAKGQIETLSTHAEERVAAFVSGSQLSSGEVFRSVHELLPGLIPPYREENRFRFHSVMAGGEAATPSKPATPQAGGAAARAEAREQSQEGGRPADNSGGNGARAESAFPARGASLKDRLPVTSIDGSVRWINPAGSDPATSIWTPEDEKRISACVFDGRAAVRSELEGILSGKEWPALAALVEPFRRYAVAVFDVYASAYGHVARTVAAYQEALDQLLLPMVLRDLFGREWDRSPGAKVVRMLWQDGRDGKPEGREVTVVAGNDPDPTCVFYDLLSNAIEHRYRFFEPLPPPAPGEPPGINLTNLEWWQYIGLSERHSLAMAIKPYIEDRVAHWRFIYSPTAPPESDNTRGEVRSDLAQQPEHPESGTVMPPASMAARASSSSGASAMDSPTRVKFEAGLALAEVTLAQDLKDLGPSLEIARKYVTSATLTLARCILTPHCAEPYEAIRRAYDFAEWFAAETMKTAWVWLGVFSEMSTSGKLEKYKRKGRTEDGAPKGMTDAELREWHGCLSGVAQEALDEFVPEFWKERLKYFSGIAGGGAPTESETARATEDRQDPVASVQEPTDSHVDSDVPKQDRIKPRPDPAAPVTPAELWGHFSYEKTSKTSKFRDLLIYSFVRLSIPGGRTNRDVVEQIAKGSHIPVESLSDELNQPVDPGSRAIFGVAGDEFDRIADNYDNMQWWVSDAGLNMAIASPANPNPRIPTFDELAGRLFAEPAETQKRPPRGKTPIRDPRDPATEQPHTPERSSPPKPQLPLDVCVAIAEAERKIRRLLEDCHDISIPIILEPHVLEAAEVMRRHVSEAFKPRVEYYASQSGFCRAWLNEAADETISAIVGLVPFRFTRGSRYLNSVPSIKKDLREILRARIEEWLDRTNDVDKQKAGDPALDLPKLPSEAQAQLDGAKRIAQETLGHARIHLKRTAETKGRLEALGVAGGESAEQVELQGQYERHLENARRCVQLAIGEMFDAYAAKHWQAVCPDAVTFSGRLPAIAAEVESSLTCPELASTIAEALSQKRIEWADKTAREQAATAGRLEHVTKLLPIVAEFRREFAKNPNKKTELLEKLATDVVTLHLGQLVPLVTNLAEYGQFEDKVSWARPFVNQAIRFLDDEDLKVAWSFVEAKCELLLAEAARQLRDKATPDSNARRAGSATASVGRGKGTGQLSAAGAAELAVAIDKVEAILKSHDAQAPDEHAKIRATEPCKLYDEKTALADGLRTQATVWATQALLDVAERDVMPREPDAFDRLLDRLIHRLAEEAAARFSLAGYRGFPNHHSEIRARLLEDLPKIAQDSRDVNRRRYLGDWPTRETETEAKPKTEQGTITHPSALPKSPDAPKQQAIKPQPGTERKGDAMLLADKRLVSFGTAEQYLGITDRQRQKLMNSGELKVEGKGMNRKITTESLKAYLPPDIPN